MDVIEVKLEKMCRELEYIQKENCSLRSNEEKLNAYLSELEKKFMKKTEKYNRLNETTNSLQLKLKELESFALETKNHEVKKNEESKKNKTENKKKVF